MRNLVRLLALPVLVVGLPASADVPGAPRADPPVCPAGTHLEGPYRFWSCVPDDGPPAAPVVEEPAGRVEPTPPTPAVAPAPPTSVPDAPPPADAPLAPAVEAAPPESAGCACHAAAPAPSGSLALLVLFALARRARTGQE